MVTVTRESVKYEIVSIEISKTMAKYALTSHHINGPHA